MRFIFALEVKKKDIKLLSKALDLYESHVLDREPGEDEQQKRIRYAILNRIKNMKLLFQGCKMKREDFTATLTGDDHES